MKIIYETVSKFIRWGVIDVIVAIIALPLFMSIVSSI
ncbi:hypothetical protein Slit_1399 [Sideroxydans lithotrophicus ES-1]|uniref:Uncharacterized protein n=1 Tax=Sideroxydans lithotrophicus (strain ES-1) TaxID=580332 RepID=D5CRQ0_SIDLE|nr:hypothetical protein Slit_1399 [Sideroxydans lithotrophicus ES-1]